MNPPPTPELAREALLSLVLRARGGLAIHPIVWATIGVLTDLLRTEPIVFWLALAGFSGITAVRLVIEPGLRERVARDPAAVPAARRLFLAVMLASPALWGVLGASTLLWSDLEPARLPIWFALTGLAGTASVPMAFDRAVRTWYPALTLGPAIGVALPDLRPDTVFPVVAGLLYLGYIWRASAIVHDVYWAGAHAQAELERRAAEFEQASTIDALTGVHNRFHFDRRLALEWARAERDGHPLALLMIDLDHFKHLNDAHGHPFGDECLRRVARALGSALHRPSDLLARYGGEEFAALLVGADAEGALLVAGRMREAVRSEAPRTADGQPVVLDCSIGVCWIAKAAETTAAVAIADADRALYAAKLRGRGRIVHGATRGAEASALP